MAIKLQLQLRDADAFWKQVFQSEKVEVGDSADLADGVSIVNMTQGARNISAAELLTFVIENREVIALGVLSTALWDLIKAFAVVAIVNGKKILSQKDLEVVLEEDQAKPKGEDEGDDEQKDG